MRVAQVIGKLAAAGVEAVVNNYYCSMNTERIQFDYFIDEDSELAPPQEMIDRGARYFVVPSTRHAADAPSDGGMVCHGPDGVRRAGGGLDVWKKSGRGGARHGAAQRHRRRRVRL